MALFKKLNCLTILFQSCGISLPVAWCDSFWYAALIVWLRSISNHNWQREEFNREKCRPAPDLIGWDWLGIVKWRICASFKSGGFLAGHSCLLIQSAFTIWEWIILGVQKWAQHFSILNSPCRFEYQVVPSIKARQFGAFSLAVIFQIDLKVTYILPRSNHGWK